MSVPVPTEEMLRWTPVTSPPPHEGRYLVTNGKWVGLGAMIGGEWLRLPQYEAINVTHWMPVPEPPK